MTHAALRGFAAACLATTCLVGIVAEAQAQIEEIVVTTRKRAENLQEVPIVVTAFTAESLQRKGLAELKDVVKYTAGVQFDEGFSAQDTRIVIRGLSPTRGRPNVAFLQDDVDISSEAINTGGSSFLINPRLFDLERIEIVKGPHSALYGRSAFAGAINYITKKPGDEFEGTVNMEAATYGKFEGKVGVSGPVVPGVLNMGINVAGWTFDGFYDNSVTGQSIGGGKGAGVAASALWTPSDNFKGTFRTEYSSDHFEPSARAQVAANRSVPLDTDATSAIWGSNANTSAPTTLANARLGGMFRIVSGPAPSVGKDGLTSRLSTDPRTGKDYSGNERSIFRTTMRLDYEFELATLSSISHYGTGHTNQFEDAQRQGDFNNLMISAETNFNTETRLLSEEIRLVSNGEGPLTWAAGALYWNEVARQNNRSFTCFVPTGQTCGPLTRQVGTSRVLPDQFFNRDTLHHSLYALIEYDVIEDLGLSLEIRHTWEDEDLFAPGTVSTGIGCPAPFRSLLLDGTTLRCGAGAPAAFTPTFNTTVGNYQGFETRSKFFVPRFGIDYKVTDDALIYASAAKGIKPGGVSTISGGASGIDEAANRYLAEKLWVYEVGAKTTWLDGAMQLNLAGYYQDFSDKQTSTQLLLSTGTLGTRIINASSARVYGVDLETGIAVNDNLTISAGYTWLDAKYNSFKIVGNSLGNIAAAGCIPLRTVNGQLVPFTGPASPTNKAESCELDRTGNKLEDTPTHSLQFSPSWSAPLTADIGYFIETSVQYTGKRFDTEDNDFYFRGYWNTDLRLGLNSEEAGWEVTAFVTNLFNDDKVKTGFASPNFNTSYCLGGPPCNIPPIPPLGSGPFNFVLQNHATLSMPDKRQIGVRAKYTF